MQVGNIALETQEETSHSWLPGNKEMSDAASSAGPGVEQEEFTTRNNMNIS